MATQTPRPGRVPKRFLQFQQDYPEIFKAYKQLGTAAGAAGPLDAKTRELVRLAIVIGSRHEGAVHSHTRRALEAGCSPEEIRHAVLLSITSIGFPNAMAAMSWVDDVLKK
jgi:alkylhydroperoxidase/carboxymuconolactone decarboxylase family protein YurZ